MKTTLLALAISCSFFAVSQPQWIKTYGHYSGEQAEHLAEDFSGNIYVTGVFSDTIDHDPAETEVLSISDGSQDIYVQKFDGDGNLIWALTFGGPQTDWVNDLKLDPFGNVLIAGGFRDSIDLDPGAGESVETGAENAEAFVISLNSDGDFNWHYCPRTSFYGMSVIACIYPDQIGNVFAGGHFRDTSNFDVGVSDTTLVAHNTEELTTDGFFLKLDVGGNFQWVRRLGGNGADRVENIAIDGFNNIVLTGAFQDTVDFDEGSGEIIEYGDSIYTDPFVAKHDSEGGISWVRTFPEPNSAYISDLEIDSNDDILMVGHFNTEFNAAPDGTSLITGDFLDVFIEKMDSDGNFVWVKSFGGTDSDNSYCFDLDAADNIYVAGYFETNIDLDPGSEEHLLTSEEYFDTWLGWVKGEDMFIAKYNPEGEFLWGADTKAERHNRAYDILASYDGSVIFCGFFTDTTNFAFGGPANIHVPYSNFVKDAVIGKISAFTSVDPISFHGAMKLYPNPAANIITIETGDTKYHELQLYDMSGRFIRKETVNGTTIEMHLSTLPSGTYTVRLLGDSEVRQLRFVKT